MIFHYFNRMASEGAYLPARKGVSQSQPPSVFSHALSILNLLRPLVFKLASVSCNGLIGEGGEEGVQRERQGYRGEEVQGGR